MRYSSPVFFIDGFLFQPVEHLFLIKPDLAAWESEIRNKAEVTIFCDSPWAKPQEVGQFPGSEKNPLHVALLVGFFLNAAI